MGKVYKFERAYTPEDAYEDGLPPIKELEDLLANHEEGNYGIIDFRPAKAGETYIAYFEKEWLDNGRERRQRDEDRPFKWVATLDEGETALDDGPVFVVGKKCPHCGERLPMKGE